MVQFSSVQSLSRDQLFATPWIARPPCPSPTPGVHSDSSPSSQWCHPAISSSVVPFSSCPQSLPAWDSFPMSQLFAWGSQSTGVSALASFLPKKSQADLLQNGLVGSPCSPRDSQESSPTPQFKSINFSALSLFHSPALISIHDYWKNHTNYLEWPQKNLEKERKMENENLHCLYHSGFNSRIIMADNKS